MFFLLIGRDLKHHFWKQRDIRDQKMSWLITTIQLYILSGTKIRYVMLLPETIKSENLAVLKVFLFTRSTTKFTHMS